MSAMPRWFRFAVFGLAALLLVPFLVVRTGIDRGAVAATLASVAGSFEPVVRAQLALPDQFLLAADGSYVINGMPVEYHTYAAPESPELIVKKFHDGFAAAGYEQAILDAPGAPTLVAVHPETKMMLTVRFVYDQVGTLGMRLTQQDLSKLDPDYKAAIPGLPVYPGATERIAISSGDGSAARSLSFLAKGSPAMVEQFYRGEMRAAGWRLLEAPVKMPPGAPLPLFFEQGALESSVLIVPQEGSSATFVMVTLTGDPEELSS